MPDYSSWVRNRGDGSTYILSREDRIICLTLLFSSSPIKVMIYFASYSGVKRGGGRVILHSCCMCVCIFPVVAQEKYQICQVLTYMI